VTHPPTLNRLSENGQLRLAEEVLAAKPGASIKPLLQGAPQSLGGKPALLGPGEYEVEAAHDKVKAPRQFNTGPSNSFQAGKSHLPRSWKPVNPGPCEYDPKDDVVRAGANSMASAAFNSQQASIGHARSPVPPAPGPAWYSPRANSGAKSFHLNMKNTFVP